jgi:hypothetical protein
MQTSKLRGNSIYMDGQGVWRYEHDDVLVSDNIDRKCGHCSKDSTEHGHDGCLGTLKPDVNNACCGHGVESDAYIQFTTGAELRGIHAAEAFESLISQGKENENLAKSKINRV